MGKKNGKSVNPKTGVVTTFGPDGKILTSHAGAGTGIQPGVGGLASGTFGDAGEGTPGATGSVESAYAKFRATEVEHATIGSLNGHDVVAQTMCRADGTYGVLVTWTNYRGWVESETILRGQGDPDETEVAAAIEEWKARPPMGPDTRTRFRKILDEASWLMGRD